jgi:galactosylceramidase
MGAKRVHRLDIDTIGIPNETKMDYSFIKTLKRTLIAHGLKTRIIADDLVNTWAITDAMAKDKELADAIDIVATHYVRFKSTEAARNCGKPIWSSEDGPWSEAWGTAGDQSPPYAEILNRNYLDGRMTSTLLWCLSTSYYDILDLPNAGLLRANTPWSGRFELKSPLWVVAHTTQFAKPGWQYLNQACVLLPKGGSCVALKDKRNYSVIIETLAAREPQHLAFTV